MAFKMSDPRKLDITVESVIQDQRSDFPESTCMSMKSDQSMTPPLKFRKILSPHQGVIQDQRSDFPESTCMSMKSDQSMTPPLKFRKILTPHQGELLSPACSGTEGKDEGERCTVSEGVLKELDHGSPAITPQNKLPPQYQTKLKSRLKKKCKIIYEGNSDNRRVNEIYTELYITESYNEEIINEHEVRQIQTAGRRPTTQEKPIKCNDLFKDTSIRTVLTRGVAGIGKTVSVQKFILDWVEGKANNDVLMFPLPFRELNLMGQRKLSLMNLLHNFFPETKEMPLVDLNPFKIVFIFDGLDECRLPLNFHSSEIVYDVTTLASVDVLLTNLIKGNLLPSAHLWITSRPGASHQIPSEWVGLSTEIRGFCDPQKEEYFRKRIYDQSLANKIISHIKSSRSLHIMCRIPVFCWITSTVLVRMLSTANSRKIPKTLTQMFTHFLIFQIKQKDRKYHGKCGPDPQQTINTLLALGKLAFQQLERGNLIFYEEDLRECGIDVREASVYSGVCTQIFREELGLHIGKVYSFVHLSVQEFLAALYAFLSFTMYNRNVLVNDHFKCVPYNFQRMSDFLKSAVDKALQSERGQLDLFLRFLLGLSLESNQTLLQHLLPQTKICFHKTEEIVKYIKRKIKRNACTENNASAKISINLFHCLHELKDDSLVKMVQTFLNKGGKRRLMGAKLSPLQWSSLVFMLRTSEEEWTEFNLSKYDTSDECFLRLQTVVKEYRKAVLNHCNLTEKSCEALVSILSSSSSSIRDLDLSDNELQDSGVELLCAALKNPHCKLETLWLGHCKLTKKSCEDLASILSLCSSSIRELDLSDNDLKDSGVELLCAGLKSPHCKLEILSLNGCNLKKKSCEALALILSLRSTSLRELDLSKNDLKDQNQIYWPSMWIHTRNLFPADSGVELLCAGLKNPHCKLEKLWLGRCNLTEESCAALSSVLSLDSSRLKELNLSNNYLMDSGVELLSTALKNPHCKLESLGLYQCSLTEESCGVLASVLRSDTSHLIELDFGDNPLKNSGLKLLSAGLENEHCKLEILGLYNSKLTEESCTVLSSVFSSDFSRLKELNLSNNNLKDSGIKKLLVGLKNSNCKLEILKLHKSSLTKESCEALSIVLSSDSSILKELNLSNNDLKDSGVTLLSTGLENPHCKLEKLWLGGCNLTEKSCAALSTVLSSNSSRLKVLDLVNNDVKKLLEIFEDKLDILRVDQYNLSKGSSVLSSIAGSNNSSLQRLDVFCPG
ncbi:NACHT, LRR and PYD domains-containing protein 12-like isoform X2 [Trichomycterus rosablanca]|uniref:NACHT, LRR and PYD domains-containing protein 12-like isoform X2 n=1 Tax=Trichomycterus rosablanca TaxID=2290929 RepID=UPI002F35DFAC